MKLKNKFIVSIVTLTFALVTLCASTFAWFAGGGTTSKTESFSGSVVGGEGFEIAVIKSGTKLTINQKWYTGTLPSSEILDCIVDHNELKALTFEGNKFVDLQKNSSDKYISFDLWFKSVQQGTITSINKASNNQETSTEITSQEINWYSDQSFILAKSTLDGQSVQVKPGQAVSFKSSSAARILLEGDQRIIYEAEESHSSNTNMIFSAGNSIGFAKSDIGAHAYYQAKTGITLTIPSSYATKVLGKTESYEIGQLKQVDSNISFEGLADEARPSYAGSFLGRIKVFVWLEGYDGECMDAIFNEKVQVMLGFKIV